MPKVFVLDTKRSERSRWLLLYRWINKLLNVIHFEPSEFTIGRLTVCFRGSRTWAEACRTYDALARMSLKVSKSLLFEIDYILLPEQ